MPVHLTGVPDLDRLIGGRVSSGSLVLVMDAAGSVRTPLGAPDGIQLRQPETSAGASHAGPAGARHDGVRSATAGERHGSILKARDSHVGPLIRRYAFTEEGMRNLSATEFPSRLLKGITRLPSEAGVKRSAEPDDEG